MDMPDPSRAAPSRVVHSADALAWLPSQGRIEGASLFTSLPDVSELPGVTLVDYPRWLRRAARLVIEACPDDDGVALFHHKTLQVALSGLAGYAESLRNPAP